MGFDLGGAVGAFLDVTIGNSQRRKNAGEANDWANEASQVNRAFQERMSNSAHQREVKDLQAAGLNPILSATGGPGSSTPAGATADTQKADYEDGYAKIISSALEAKLMNSQNLLTKAQGEQAASATDVNRATEKKLAAETFKTTREAQILGPAASIMEKATDTLTNGASKAKKFFDDISPEKNNLTIERAIPRKPKP